MPGGAPFVVRVGGAGRRKEGLAVELGDLVLEHLHTFHQGRIIGLEEGHGIIGGGERVHEHELDVAVVLAHRYDLLGREVKEGVVALHLQQTLGRGGRGEVKEVGMWRWKRWCIRICMYVVAAHLLLFAHLIQTHTSAQPTIQLEHNSLREQVGVWGRSDILVLEEVRSR